MRLPQWLALLIAGTVILFGLYRLWISFRGPTDVERAKAKSGMMKMPRRQHALVGVLYLLVGTALILTSYGWNPFRSAPAEPTPPPAAGTAAPTAIPVAP